MKLMIKTFDQLWKRERASFPSRHDFTPQIYGWRDHFPTRAALSV